MNKKEASKTRTALSLVVSIKLKNYIGDSINGQYPITNIDSIFLGNSFRKRYLISANTMIDSLFLIEGIGFSSGLFQSFSQFENNDYLVCFSQNNQGIWTNPYSQTQYPCNTPLYIKSNDLSEYKIYPNPSNGKLYINCNYNIKTIEVLSLLGEVIFYKNYSNYSKNQEIDLPIITKGIYFVKVHNNSETHVEKILFN